MMRRAVALSLVLASGAAAQDTPGLAPEAHALRAAWNTGGADGVVAAAARRGTDGWSGAVELAVRGEREVALAVAAEGTRLHAHVEAAASTEGARAALARLRRAEKLERRSEWKSALEELARLDPEALPPILRVRAAAVGARAWAWRGHRGRAAAAFEEAVALANLAGWQRAAFDAAAEGAGRAGEARDFERALRLWRLAREAADRLADDPAAAHALVGAAAALRARGDKPGAARIARDALARLEKTKLPATPAARARAARHRAEVHRLTGKPDRARAAMAEAVREAEAAGFPDLLARTLFRQASLLQQTGQRLAAAAPLRRILELHDQRDPLEDERIALLAAHRLGSLFRTRGKESAEGLAHRSAGLERARRADNRDWIATCAGSVGWALGQADDAEGARELYEESLRLHLATGNDDRAANMHLTLGIIASNGRDFDAAATHYERARDLWKSISYPPGVVSALVNLATLELSRERWRPAADAARAGVAIAKEQGNALARRRFGFTLVQALARLEEHDAALAEVAAMRKEGVRDSAELLCVEGVAYYRAGRWREAIAVLERGARAFQELVRGVPMEQGARLRGRFGNIITGHGAAASMQVGDVGSAMHFVEHAATGAFQETLLARDALRDAKVDPALVRAETEVQVAHARALVRLRRAEKRAEVRAARAAVEEAALALKRIQTRIQLERKRGVGDEPLEPASLARLQAALAEDEALVIYVNALDFVFPIVVRRDAARIVRLDADFNDLMALSLRVLEAVASRDPEAPALVARLRSVAVDPLELGSDVRRVLGKPVVGLAPTTLPLLFPDREALRIPSGTAYLTLRERDPEAGEGVLALGDPDYGSVGSVRPHESLLYYRAGGRLSPLPGSRAEARAVGDRVLLGGDASETRFRDETVARRRWRAIHLACHGLWEPERPMLSALALTPGDGHDGLLTAIELSRMDLRADLVVLSACETGRPGQTWRDVQLGLPRAMLLGGASSVLASGWKVDDDATRALMTAFYAAWREPGPDGRTLDAVAALKRAQDKVRADPKWAHPFYWAGWDLWGVAR